MAYLQYAGSGPMRHEEKLLTEGLGRLGVPVRHYSLKRIIGRQILAVDHYEGDDSVPLNMDAVESAVTAYYRSGTAPAAYAIDFGVLANGETTLVEANDGYSLGAYDIAADQYTALLMNRWRDLLASDARPARSTSF
ncbi:ATP-grasp domain-containing protein [Nocardia fluminea]|uniref:ATP-grasp domain-containing protein n=1 Tax=Nocardia fluminea TaxID=134984 RepID=UPI0036477326